MAKPVLFSTGSLRPDQNEEWERANEQYKDCHPRDMTVEQLNELGHEKEAIYSVIRRNCIDCVGNQPGLVRSCTITWCPYWPYRMGFNPFNRRELSEEQRQEMAERARRQFRHEDENPC